AAPANAAAASLVRVDEARAAQVSMALPERDHLSRETQHRVARGIARPVDPARVVVLAVRVIVAALRAQPLVSRQQHRNALAQQEQRDEVTGAPGAEALDRGIVARPLDARVPAEVVIAAVAVVL